VNASQNQRESNASGSGSGGTDPSADRPRVARGHAWRPRWDLPSGGWVSPRSTMESTETSRRSRGNEAWTGCRATGAMLSTLHSLSRGDRPSAHAPSQPVPSISCVGGLASE
jgi:hypothetical protein